MSVISSAISTPVPPAVRWRRRRGGVRRRARASQLVQRSERSISLDARVAQEALADQSRRSSMRPSAMSSPRSRELGGHLLPDLEAARADPRADRRGLGRDLADAALRDPAREPAPAAVDHRDAAAAPRARREGNRRRRRAARGLPPRSPSRRRGPDCLRRRRSHAERALGSSWRTMSAPCTCLPETMPAASTPTASHISARFAWTVRGVVVGQEAEVERGERALAHATGARREGGTRARQALLRAT